MSEVTDELRGLHGHLGELLAEVAGLERDADRVDELEQEMVEMRGADEELTTLQDAVADHARGIIDLPELLEVARR